MNKKIGVLIIPSPCINKCIKDKGKCQGCHRTIKEITDWSCMSNTNKAVVWKRINLETEYNPVNDEQILFSQRFSYTQGIGDF